ncbi:unnamed protein product, partial [Urochloa humidicola]
HLRDQTSQREAELAAREVTRWRRGASLPIASTDSSTATISPSDVDAPRPLLTGQQRSEGVKEEFVQSFGSEHWCLPCTVKVSTAFSEILYAGQLPKNMLVSSSIPAPGPYIDRHDSGCSARLRHQAERYKQ